MEKNKFPTREELKTYFETDKYPTQSQFSDLIDSYWHKEESISLNYDLRWSPSDKKLSLADSAGNLVSEISLQTLDDEGTDLRYNADTSSLELYNSDNVLLDIIPVADFVKNVGTQLELNSYTLQLKDSRGVILSTVAFSVSNIGGLQVLLDNKLDKPAMTANYTGRWNGSTFINGIMQDNGSSAGIGNNNYSNIIWSVDSASKAALIAPRMTQVQRLAIALGTAQAGALVYQTDAGMGYYVWNGTSWQSLGGNIATADLTNVQPRVFTQNANFTWDAAGNSYYLKGLKNIGNNFKDYPKVLKLDPSTKQVVEGDALIVNIPDTLPNPATPATQTLNIVHTYTNSPTALDTNVKNLNDFIMNIGNLQFTDLTVNDWNLINAPKNSAATLTAGGGVSLKCNNITEFGNGEVMACAYPNLVLPMTKNWVFIIGGTVNANLSYHNIGVIGITESSATSNVGMLNGFLSSYSSGWQYNSINFIPFISDSTPIGQRINLSGSSTCVFTKVGNILNITVRAGNDYKTFNVDVTGINSCKPLCSLIKSVWNDNTNNCITDFGKYWIES